MRKLKKSEKHFKIERIILKLTIFQDCTEMLPFMGERERERNKEKHLTLYFYFNYEIINI